MAEIDLGDLDLDALKQLQRDVEKAIRDYESRRRKQALAAVEATAREMGFTLGELVEGAPAKGGGRKDQVNPPKYCHPENPGLTWSGRGRQPGWIKEALDAGKPLDDFLIEAA